MIPLIRVRSGWRSGWRSGDQGMIPFIWVRSGCNWRSGVRAFLQNAPCSVGNSRSRRAILWTCLISRAFLEKTRGGLVTCSWHRRNSVGNSAICFFTRWWSVPRCRLFLRTSRTHQRCRRLCCFVSWRYTASIQIGRSSSSRTAGRRRDHCWAMIFPPAVQTNAAEAGRRRRFVKFTTLRVGYP